MRWLVDSSRALIASRVFCGVVVFLEGCDGDSGFFMVGCLAGFLSRFVSGV